MAKDLTVYQQMKSSSTALMSVLANEIGVKASVPFSVKAVEALRDLGEKLTEAEAIKAANTFLSDLQTLMQGGVTPNDHDKIDFVKRGKTIRISARAEALLRAARRKGYRIVETIVPVPKEDKASTYFEEHFTGDVVVYVLKDKRRQGDRKITAERLVNGYFDKFLCRLDIAEANTGKRIMMTAIEVSNEEVMAAQASSDNGIFESMWEDYTDTWGYVRKRKIITDKLNEKSIWCIWTQDMVAKTLLRKAMKRIKEALPELGETVLAFDAGSSGDWKEVENFEAQPMEFKAIEQSKVNIFELTQAQQEEVDELREVYTKNPSLAKVHAEEIANDYNNGESARSICDSRYAELVCLQGSRNVGLIKPVIDDLEREQYGETEAD